MTITKKSIEKAVNQSFAGMVLLVSILFLQPEFSRAALETAYDRPGPYSVKSLDFPGLKDTKRNNRSVPLKIHFPAKGKNFPLVIMSHGGAGTRDANIFQAKHTASHGYVVICTEHVYSNNIRVRYHMSKAGGSMRFREALHRTTKDPKAVLERPRDVSFAIDRAISWNTGHKELAGKIDTGKIAVMGHSFGAYTTLAVCGAQPILDHLEPPVSPGKGLAGDLSDSRVTFGLAMSPQGPGTSYFNKNSYKTINRPLICLTGSKDWQWRFNGRMMLAHTRKQVFKLLPAGKKYFLWLKNADHLCFSHGPKSYLLPSRARPDAQRISKAVMVLACDYFLKGKKQALDRFNKEYVSSLCGKVVTKVDWYEK